jgi:carbamoyl-phosphate synthase large subunit
MKKKLMIVGAGENQVPIINRANQKGYYTIVISIDGDYPGFNICDQTYRIDVREKEHILEVARKENICGILTDQTDMSVPTVAFVAEKLGLPGIGYECAICFTNKYKMRQCCEAIGIQMPGYRQASTYEEAEKYARQLQFPLIIKPVDNQGSRGVSKINQYDDLKEKYFSAKEFSLSGCVIIEEFFQGREIVVEGFASDYNFTNLVIGDSDDFDLSDIFIPKQRIFPTSLNEELRVTILSLNKMLVEKLGLKFGITHSEYLVNETTDEICLVEIAARGGGVFTSSDLIPLACGIDVNDLLIKIATGESTEIDKNRYVEAASAYICFYLPEGKIQKISGIDEVISLQCVHKAYLDNIMVGKQINKISDKTMRLGPILIKGENRQAIQETINRIQETLVIEVETSKGVKGIVW